MLILILILNINISSENEQNTLTRDPARSVASKKDSEVSFYSLYTAGSSLSLDLDIWESELGHSKEKSSPENVSKNRKKNSKSSTTGSFNEFCKETGSWLEEESFCAPKATIDNFEDDEIVSSFSNFNRLMENLNKENHKMSDLSDFDERQEGGRGEKASQGSSSKDSSKSSSEEQVETVSVAISILLLIWQTDIPTIPHISIFPKTISDYLLAGFLV